MNFDYENNDLMSQLCMDIHAGNVAAGWWTDLATGASILETRNKAELLMLTVSELSEGSEGFAQDLNDDKLPQYKMLDVELADAAIRLCDQIGAVAHLDEFGLVIAGCHSRGTIEAWGMRTLAVDGALMLIVNQLSLAMEHVRKNRTTKYRLALWDALLTIFRFADQRGIELHEIIEAKRAFNAQRSDHKVANRLQADGKKF